MKVDILTEETIPDVFNALGAKNPKFIDDMREAVEAAEDHGAVIYVRYGLYFLQRIWVDRALVVNHPELDEMIRNEQWWIDNQ
jgi:hypothetical protein